MSIQSLWNLGVYILRQIVRRYCADMERRAVAGLAQVLSAMAYTLFSVLIAMAFMAFVTMGAVCLLETVMASHWAYLVVAGFYGVLWVAVRLLRRRVIDRPVLRHLSRMFGAG